MFFFFNDTATTEIYTLSLHDALPILLEPEVEDAARRGDPLAELDVELGLLERRRDLVLDDLDADAVADGLRALLERLDPADVEALRRVELQRAAAVRAPCDAARPHQLARDDAAEARLTRRSRPLPGDRAVGPQPRRSRQP